MTKNDDSGLKTALGDFSELLLYLSDILEVVSPELSTAIQSCLINLAYEPILNEQNMNLSVTLFCAGLTLKDLKARLVHDFVKNKLLNNCQIQRNKDAHKYFDSIIQKYFPCHLS